MSALSDAGFDRIRWATFGLTESFEKFEKRYNQQLDWVRLFRKAEKISIIITVDNPKTEKGLLETLRSLKLQSYPHWEAIVVGNKNLIGKETDSRITFLAKNDEDTLARMKNRGALKATGLWIGFMSAGDVLSPVALYFFAEEIDKKSASDLFYCNEVTLSENSEKLSNFLSKSKFSNFNLLHFNPIGKLWLVRYKFFSELKGFEESLPEQEEHDFFLRFSEKSEAWEHLPSFLYLRRKGNEELTRKEVLIDRIENYLKRKNQDASVELQQGCLKVSPRLNTANALLSVIICFRNKANWTLRALKQLDKNRGTVPVEVFLVDNQSNEKELDSIRKEIKQYGFPVEIVNYDHVFNYGNMHNTVIRQKCRGQVLFLLNNDVFLSNGKCLDELYTWASQESIGTVGMLLRYGHHAIQHSGMRVWFGGKARLVRTGNAQGGDIYSFENREVFANTFAACFIKRKTFDDLGGFREKDLANGYGDLAFNFECLKAGLKNIYLGHIEATHLESGSRELNNDEYWEDCILEKEYPEILQQMLREDTGYNRLPEDENEIFPALKELALRHLRLKFPWLKTVKRSIKKATKGIYENYLITGTRS